MLGGAGIDATSLAQSRQVGTGAEHVSPGLDGISTRDGGGKTVAEGDSDTAAAVKGVGDGKTTGLGLSWMNWGIRAHMGMQAANGELPCV